MDDNIIQKIIDSEKLAQSVIREARDEKLYHESRTQAEIETYRNTVRQDTQIKISVFLDSHLRESTEKAKIIEASAREDADRLTATASAHKSEWISALFQKILDGEIG